MHGEGVSSGAADRGSAIEGVISLPLGEVGGVALPLSQLQLAVAIDDLVTHGVAQYFALLG